MSFVNSSLSIVFAYVFASLEKDKFNIIKKNYWEDVLYLAEIQNIMFFWLLGKQKEKGGIN